MGHSIGDAELAAFQYSRASGKLFYSEDPRLIGQPGVTKAAPGVLCMMRIEIAETRKRARRYGFAMGRFGKEGWAERVSPLIYATAGAFVTWARMGFVA